MIYRLGRIILSLIFLTGSIIALPESRIALASTEQVGVGLAFGEPGGLTGYYRINDKSFAQAYLSPYSLSGADIAMTFPRALSDAPALTPYIGGGVFIFYYDRWWRQHHSGSGIGVRMPVGVLVKIPDAPFHLHAEISPAMTLTPFAYTFAQGMMGVRYLF